MHCSGYTCAQFEVGSAYRGARFVVLNPTLVGFLRQASSYLVLGLEFSVEYI